MKTYTVFYHINNRPERLTITDTAESKPLLIQKWLRQHLGKCIVDIQEVSTNA